MSTFNFAAARASIKKEWEATAIPTLKEYIKIPSQSPSWEQLPYTLINQAAQKLLAWAQALNLKNTTVTYVPTTDSNQRTPIILVVVEASKTTNVHNVLIYGHMDKQPPLTDQWSSPSQGPYVPVIVEDSRYGPVLYGRGGADDGYSICAALTSIQAIQLQNIPHDRYVVIIEASEESGSPDLPYYVEAYASTIQIPNLIVCLDSGSSNYDQLFITTSLRGVIGGNVRVDILTEGRHSGVASGVVPETFRIQRQLIDRIEHQDGVFNSDFRVTIPEYRKDEAKALADVLGPDFYKTMFPWMPGAQPVSTDPVTLILNRTWEPSLCVIGADGIPATADGGNVLRPFTTFKISIRTPPTLNAVEADQKLSALMTQSPTPYGATIDYSPQEPGQGWDSPQLADWLSPCLDKASKEFFPGKKSYVAQGEGGSIPFMAMLGEKFPKAQFVITGVLGPDSNAHAGNELLNLNYAQDLSGAIAYILASLAEQTNLPEGTRSTSSRRPVLVEGECGGIHHSSHSHSHKHN